MVDHAKPMNPARVVRPGRAAAGDEPSRRPDPIAATVATLRRAARAVAARFDRTDADLAALEGASDAEIERLTRRPHRTADDARWDLVLYNLGGFHRR